MSDGNAMSTGDLAKSGFLGRAAGAWRRIYSRSMAGFLRLWQC